MDWSPAVVDAALEDARSLVRSDGADLLVVEVNEKAARVVLQLDVSGASCETGTCVMPGAMLQPLISDALARHLTGEFELQLIDPRLA